MLPTIGGSHYLSKALIDWFEHSSIVADCAVGKDEYKFTAQRIYSVQ